MTTTATQSKCIVHGTDYRDRCDGCTAAQRHDQERMMKDPFSLDPDATTDVAPRPAAPSGPPATPKQVAFLDKLVGERDIEALSGNLYERAFDVATGSDKFIGKAEATKLINALLHAPKVEHPVNEDPPEGIHLVQHADGTHDVYKVQVAVHGSGKLYAKQLDKATGDFFYVARKPFKNLNEDTLMTLEQAKEFGHLYGMCVRCGRTLTDENSIAAGIGPVCAEKF